MIKTINEWEFVEEFKRIRPDNFSSIGLHKLFNYFEMLEDDIKTYGEQIELDVIAICCEYSEYDSLKEFQDEYGSEYESIDDIERETEVIRIDDDSFIIRQF
tara:strand:- start:757 stop:1062 length:306 start_codon:yes stop_codon:yes gene_type:complete